jgi:hypothetical protein
MEAKQLTRLVGAWIEDGNGDSLCFARQRRTSWLRFDLTKWNHGYVYQQVRYKVSTVLDALSDQPTGSAAVLNRI